MGQGWERSVERSALMEAVTQLTRALDQIAALPPTPALRRQQINFKSRSNALMHTKGYLAPETKAAWERARLLIEQAEALGEPLEDPLLLFSVLYGFWSSWHSTRRRWSTSLRDNFWRSRRNKRRLCRSWSVIASWACRSCTQATSRSQSTLDRANALYDPAADHPLANRFGTDVRVCSRLFDR